MRHNLKTYLAELLSHAGCKLLVLSRKLNPGSYDIKEKKYRVDDSGREIVQHTYTVVRNK